MKRKKNTELTTEFIRWVVCLECDHHYFIEEEVPKENHCPVCGSREYEDEDVNGAW